MEKSMRKKGKTALKKNEETSGIIMNYSTSPPKKLVDIFSLL